MIIIVNFKEYVKGNKVLKLTKICNREGAIAAVKTSDMRKIRSAIKPAMLLGQQVDNLRIIKKYAFGSLINHSDHPLNFSEIKKIIQQLRKNQLISIVCAKNSEQTEKIAKYKPDIIAIEPPELIGGDKAVSQVKPKEIISTIKVSRGIPVFCGAGIRTKQDVLLAGKLGVRGVLVSSAIINAQYPEKTLKRLII